MYITMNSAKRFWITALLLLGALPAFADGHLAHVGVWNILVDANGVEGPGVLTITHEDGKFGGTSASDQGVLDVSDINFEDGTLTFILEIEAADLTIEFEGTIKGDSIKGSYQIPDMGVTLPMTGTRAGSISAIVGTWNLMVESQLGNNPRTLVINEDMTGTYGGGDFDDFEISNLEIEGNSIEFNVNLSVQSQELPSTVNLTLDGTNVKGTLNFVQGQAQIVGEKAAAAGFVGSWKLTVDSQLGINERDLVINEDMTGTYSGDIGSFDVTDVKVDGDSVSFTMTLDLQGQSLPTTFQGKLDGETLSGELDVGVGVASVTGKKQ